MGQIDAASTPITAKPMTMQIGSGTSDSSEAMTQRDGMVDLAVCTAGTGKAARD